MTNGLGGDVAAATMEGAAAVAIWHLNEARRIIGAHETPQRTSDAKLLLDWMLRQAENTIEPRDILNKGPGPLRDRKRRNTALAVLFDKHFVREIKAGEEDSPHHKSESKERPMSLVDRRLTRTVTAATIATIATP